jgi:hypothetical protein
MFTRRSLLCFALRVLAAPSLDGLVARTSRCYRVHATVELLSVPLVSKDNVGGAWFMVEQAVSGTSRTTVLQFSGGSWPERLRGFNRFGMTREEVREEGAAILESAYLSFMTSSAEKSIEQARQAFEDTSRVMPITVAHGNATRSGYSSALDRLTASARYTWSNAAQLLEEIRGRVSAEREVSLGEQRASAFPTFLYAVRAAVLAGAETGRCTFIHDAKLYRLRTRLKEQELTGWIAELGASHEFEFRVWFDSRRELPVRIEFRPKSFLRLVFEHDPLAKEPV